MGGNNRGNVKMYSADNIVRSYLMLWNEAHGMQNIEPVRFNLKPELRSPAERFSEEAKHDLEMALAHLTVNSMMAISGINEPPDAIMRKYKPKKPEDIVYCAMDIKAEEFPDSIRAPSLEGLTVIDVEDNGCGINPDDVITAAKQIGIVLPQNPADEELIGIINTIFKQRLTARGESGMGNGSYIAAELIDKHGGIVYAAGTTYNEDGVLKTIGDYSREHTGARIRMSFPVWKSKKMV